MIFKAKFWTLSIAILFLSSTAVGIPTLSQNVMVSGPSKQALESALRVSKEGGNPVDMAVAYALTMSVTHPYFGSLGGGGFAMVNMDGTPKALDFREKAPSKTSPDYFSKASKNSRKGGAAIGVPGIPKGLWVLHKKYGKRPWKSLFKEAIDYSRNGFPVSSEWYSVTKRKREKFWEPGALHLLNNGQVPKPGDSLKQTGLYRAIKRLRDRGPDGFYKGDVAVDMVASVNEAGGDFRMKDLEDYDTKWREPLTAKYKGHKLYLMPPPSSGGVVIKTAFELAERLNLSSKELLSVDELHHLSEIMALSFRGRSLLGDPDYVENPYDKLFSSKYLRKMANAIKKDSTSKLEPFKESKYQKESYQTTHFIVMNNKGQAVSMTVTLNGNYGSGVISKKYGIALNNEMDDFTANPGKPNMFGLIQGSANKVEAGKRPLSSMSPSLVVKNKKTTMAIGAPGGPRIINGVFQALYRSLSNDLDMERAIFTPRLHHQFLPRVTYYEKNRFSPNVVDALKKKGHKMKSTFGVARVYGVKINKEGLLEGAADYRGEGFVGGL